MADGETGLVIEMVALVIGLGLFWWFYRRHKRRGLKTEDALKEALEDTVEHKEDIEDTAKDIVEKDTEALREGLIDGIGELIEEDKEGEPKG